MKYGSATSPTHATTPPAALVRTVDERAKRVRS